MPTRPPCDGANVHADDAPVPSRLIRVSGMVEAVARKLCGRRDSLRLGADYAELARHEVYHLRWMRYGCRSVAGLVPYSDYPFSRLLRYNEF